MVTEQDQHKRRKCGPRVKTGCITCRIRRVKCDEAKPECQRCVSTGRKCDGYSIHQKGLSQRRQSSPTSVAGQLVRRLAPIVSSPFLPSDSQRDRQLFQFYCVRSALDLSVYLNSKFWHDIVLQYSQNYGVVRQAIIAFGSSHLYALSKNQVRDDTEPGTGAVEQVVRYDKAIRSLRTYIETETEPDPHAVLICCALFFSCENSRGNREAAWQHLEKGLHILNWWGNRKPDHVLTHEPALDDDSLEQAALQHGSKLKAKVKKIEIDEELVYLFSRLDVQATLCMEARKPALNLTKLSKSSVEEHLSHATTFKTITEAQRSLDFILNRLAHFLSTTPPLDHDLISEHSDPEAIDAELYKLETLCSTWETCIHGFVDDQKPTVRQNLQTKNAPQEPNSPEWQLAVQIQLLRLHHRCWWTLFRSYRDPSEFTMSPNPNVEQVLEVCEFLAFALPVRPSAASFETDTDIAWKMISEIGVTAPLFVAATKYTDKTIQRRALAQLIALRQHSNGLHDERFLDTVITAVLRQHQHPDPDFSFKTIFQDTLSLAPAELFPLQLMDRLGQQHSPHQMENALEKHRPTTARSNSRRGSSVNDSGELLGWSRARPMT